MSQINSSVYYLETWGGGLELHTARFWMSCRQLDSLRGKIGSRKVDAWTMPDVTTQFSSFFDGVLTTLEIPF